MMASWSKKPARVPTLPPEIWTCIFRFASLVPGIFDAEIEDPFGHLSPGRTTMYNRGASEKREIRTSLITKRYLVRVCRQWHALAMPFLYESIYIGFWHVAPSLRDTLVESEQRSREDPEGRVALGWWTRRLDVAIRTANNEVEHDLLASPGYPILVDIVRCLPRLEVFSSRWMPNFLELGSPPDAPSPIAEAMKQTCCASLRRIFWPCTSSVPQRIDGLLVALPSLVSLSHFEDHHRCPLTMPFCPTLTYLSLPTCVTTHARRPRLPIPYPCLRQISLHDSHEQSNFLCLDLFLAWQGRTVTTVYVFVKYFLGALHPSVLILNRNCPNLQHLVVVFRLWSPLPASTQLLTATHLGLYLPDQGCNGNYRMVFEWLGCIISSTLKVVRLMNRRGFEDLAFGIAARLWMDAWYAADQGCAWRILRERISGLRAPSLLDKSSFERCLRDAKLYRWRVFFGLSRNTAYQCERVAEEEYTASAQYGKDAASAVI